MGEITTIPPQPRQKTEIDRARDAKRLLQAETNLLAIERACSEAIAIDLRLWRETKGLDTRQAMLRMATELPAAEHLERIADELEAAATAPPNAEQTLALLSLAEETMRRPDSPPATVKLLVAAHDLTELGFSPFIVAGALRDCRRKSRFAPAIAEIIEAARLMRHGGGEDDYAHRSVEQLASRLRMLAIRKREAVDAVARAAKADSLEKPQPARGSCTLATAWD